MKNEPRPYKGTRNNPMSGFTSPRKIKRQISAMKRQAEYDALSTSEKYEKCMMRGNGSAIRERLKLNKQLHKEKHGTEG